MQKQIKYVNIHSAYKGGKAISQALEKHASSIIYFGLDLLYGEESCS